MVGMDSMSQKVCSYGGWFNGPIRSTQVQNEIEPCSNKTRKGVWSNFCTVPFISLTEVVHDCYSAKFTRVHPELFQIKFKPFGLFVCGIKLFWKKNQEYNKKWISTWQGVGYILMFQDFKVHKETEPLAIAGETILREWWECGSCCHREWSSQVTESNSMKG